MKRLVCGRKYIGHVVDFELEWSQMAKFHRKDSLKPEEETIPFKFHVEWLFPKLMSTSKRKPGPFVSHARQPHLKSSVKTGSAISRSTV
uniref:Chromo domain-containing protein n=1 Tax=Bursaphelenchus xylophilus TaxID=6326 RepID=A0A1I7RJ46_BURXY